MDFSISPPLKKNTHTHAHRALFATSPVTPPLRCVFSSVPRGDWLSRSRESRWGAPRAGGGEKDGVRALGEECGSDGVFFVLPGVFLFCCFFFCFCFAFFSGVFLFLFCLFFYGVFFFFRWFFCFARWKMRIINVVFLVSFCPRFVFLIFCWPKLVTGQCFFFHVPKKVYICFISPESLFPQTVFLGWRKVRISTLDHLKFQLFAGCSSGFTMTCWSSRFVLVVILPFNTTDVLLEQGAGSFWGDAQGKGDGWTVVLSALDCRYLVCFYQISGSVVFFLWLCWCFFHVFMVFFTKKHKNKEPASLSWLNSILRILFRRWVKFPATRVAIFVLDMAAGGFWTAWPADLRWVSWS